MESGAREGELCERGRVGRERVREWGERERKRIRVGREREIGRERMRAGEREREAGKR